MPVWKLLFFAFFNALLVASSLAPALNYTGINASSPNDPSIEAPLRRDYFFVGGNYVLNETDGGHIFVNQLYVEKLTPANGANQSYPLVFFHGGGISGTQWLNTPDNRLGWASYFANQGYEVYLVDTWGVGRSSDESLTPTRIGSTAEIAELGFTSPEKFTPLPYYQAQLHTQWPGNGSMGDPIFDAFFASFLPLILGDRDENVMRTSGCALLERIGPSVIISHSIGSQNGYLVTDGCPQYVEGHVSVEGDTTPFAAYDGAPPMPTRAFGLTDVPLVYDPPVTDASQLIQANTTGYQYINGSISAFPCIAQANSSTSPPRQLVNIAKAPILHLTGQASVHITYDQCLIAFLRQAGVAVDWVKLADVGITGNGHFSMLEKNNLQIASYVNGWIQNLTATPTA
ncbi:MAG: hypothetical protein M1827_001922 [Pycnora praestabilis]|nr:MAG: hypothetical protein M1827_001922 [Pycnora praestabilis]